MLCTKRVCYVPKEYVIYQKSMLYTKRVCYIPKEYVMYQKSMLYTKRVCYIPKEYVMYLEARGILFKKAERIQPRKKYIFHQTLK